MAAMNGKGSQVINFLFDLIQQASGRYKFLFAGLIVVTTIITLTWWPLHHRSTFNL